MNQVAGTIKKKAVDVKRFAEAADTILSFYDHMVRLL